MFTNTRKVVVFIRITGKSNVTGNMINLPGNAHKSLAEEMVNELSCDLGSPCNNKQVSMANLIYIGWKRSSWTDVFSSTNLSAKW